MQKMARATLVRSRNPAQRCVVELVALDLAAAARHIVTVREATRESSLTPRPCELPEAQRRARDFICRRLAAGDQLLSHEGFPDLADASPEPTVLKPAAPPPARAVPASITALVARFQPARWKLEAPARRARAAWRVGEVSDAASGGAAQQALRGLVPRLVELLSSGDDLLDLCLAVAIGRLGDPGAAEAMQQLSQRGRSPATCRMARQAWLMLATPAERVADADKLLPGWAAELNSDLPGEGLLAQVEAQLAPRAANWAQLLTNWYDVAWTQPEPRAALLRLLKILPLQAPYFQGVRYVYKAAEMRRDAEALGLLHARFENSVPVLGKPSGRRYVSPDTGAWIERAHGGARAPAQAFGKKTRDYLRLRAWRQLRRRAALEHPQAPELAVSLLLGLVDDEQAPPREEQRWAYVNRSYERTTRLHHRGAGWLLVAKLLLPRWPALQTSARASRWWTYQPLDTRRPFEQRPEALQAMWDAHPEALLQLALRSRSALVQAVVVRALQDHADFVRQQPPGVVACLLQSAYEPTAALGFDVVRTRLAALTDTAEQVPWLVLMATSVHAPAREHALMHMAGDPAAFAQYAELVVALLLAADGRVRGQGRGLALLAPAEPLLRELLAALLASDEHDPGLAAGAALAEQLLQGPLGAAASDWQGLGELLPLLDHPSVPVVRLATTWLLLHPAGLAVVPPATLTRLLSAEDGELRACGARLLAAFPDEVLAQQVDLLVALATQPAASVRAAVAPALPRLAARDASLGRRLADQLHAALFQSETGEGMHDDVLRWLTQDLSGFAPARDPSGVWRALQARSTGAQRYGAWALPGLAASDYSLRQLATLARHADVGVRSWALQGLDASLPAQPTPAQSAELLPLADTGFDDAQAYTRQLFGERLADESLDVELLIAWVDHPQPWVQALGRARLVRRMSAADAALCLTRLSQHPSTQVQLFVTQWLLELPADDPAALARQLRALTPYLLTVLSQVHRGRVAKTRVTEFLRAQVQAPETAAVVAEIFARQVVTASLTDKPQYIAGLRDISRRHPQLALPFVTWTPPAVQPH
ncbi:hypothetical protein ACS5PN_20810 [Roseateles sp. NT4]|uniref:hypothetical protein n=1 Tax=Roseateles sp. NT4 TaxID=3453715 RepID=UPI003EEE99B2